MTAGVGTGPIASVFRATAAPGCRDELRRRFGASSVAVVSDKRGLLDYRTYAAVDPASPELVFESIWQDLAAVQEAFGRDWMRSYLPDGYAELITTCSVQLFVVEHVHAGDPR